MNKPRKTFYNLHNILTPGQLYMAICPLLLIYNDIVNTNCMHMKKSSVYIHRVQKKVVYFVFNVTSQLEARFSYNFL